VLWRFIVLHIINIWAVSSCIYNIYYNGFPSQFRGLYVFSMNTLGPEGRGISRVFGSSNTLARFRVYTYI